ncbi:MULTISPECIES: polyprenyl synthetase family protein [Cryobacterium]|uniref:Polyprenyl synthetase family protein n=1 Tax=Cryobacterium breve TaxID=1259258 RepID=A0ABY2IYQ1_9MICO|nr:MULTISPECIES: polyprenyl synthetase family protein [Cryobacterium]TFC96655.1 polyprenyl synthetase family protein [Cryobacterium sp. TmT3-12]TFC97548.1 polyprenyl synthetase family protein [Cryobacterium breve]
MAQSNHVIDLVHSRIDEFLETRQPIVTTISADLTPLVDFSRQFLSGGKRFRALFCYWGWQSIGACSAAGEAGASEALPTHIVSAAAALEIFHAAALVHDDIIDNSDTRRGAASAHKLFEGMHGMSGWAGSQIEFGRAAGILLGDLLLGWSDELLDEGLAAAPDATAALRARAEFNRMRTEVTVGQYLDILEERAWLTYPEAELFDRALRVIVFKSAKYSVQAPLVIGAALAGAGPEHLDALRAFGLPLGIAFQLRDDLLGVFGDASVTGKPSGDDLREGKRTVLVALARAQLTDTARGELDALLGDPLLTQAQIKVLQRTILDSGAVERIEALIVANVAEALAALEGSPITDAVTTRLMELAETVTHRAF